MSCEIASGRELVCRTGFGGVDEAVLFNYDDIETLTIVDDAVTVLTLLDGKRGYKYKFPDESSFYNENGVGSRAAGTYVVTEQLNMMLSDFTNATRQQTNTLIKARFVALVKYSDGSIVATGVQRAGHMVDSTAHSSGTAHEDKNGIDIVSSVKSPEHAPTVSSIIYAAVQIPAS